MIISLCNLLEVLAFICCLHYLYNEKIRIDVLTIGLILVELTWMRVLTLVEWNSGLTALIYPIIMLYCMIKFGSSVKKLVINNILCLMIVSILQATIMVLIFWCTGNGIMREQEMLLVNGIMFLFIIIVLQKLKIDRVSKVLQQNEKIIMLSVCAIVVSVLLFVISYKNNNRFQEIHYVVLAVSLLLVIVAVIDIGKHKVRTKEIEAELRVHKLYESSFINLIDDIRARQHEFDNHINTIYSQHYLYSTYDELVQAQKKYCDSIVYENKYNKLLSKGNATVLGFIYSKFAEAEKLGIEIEYKINIGDLKCNIPIHKLIEVLGNLLINAMEELERHDGINKLKVIMIEQSYEIAIDISNECTNVDYDKIQDFFIKGYSQKGKGRGYGLYNVKKICEEYDIIFETTIKKEQNLQFLHFVLIINKPL